MDFEEIQYALALQEAKGVGCVTAKKIISIYGSAVEVFKAHQKGFVKEGVNANLFKKMFSKEALIKSEKELKIVRERGLECLYFKNANYPKYLLDCADAPLVLFQDGKALINHYQRVISIVGTRNITTYGKDFCKDLILSIKILFM